MSLVTGILRRALRLPPPRTPRVSVDRDVAVPMPDGVVLRHDHHRPAGVHRGPVVVVRSPYGRAGWIGTVFGRLVAERGLQVVVQSVRGTAGSGGRFAPFDEADDGRATVAWVLDQPWCDGRLATLGPSYLGLTQWALAPAAGRSLKAMGTLVTASSFRDQTYAGGAFSLDNALSWTSMMRTAAAGGLARITGTLRGRRKVLEALDALPLRTGDQRATGGEVDWYQDWLRETDPGSAYWARRDHTGDVAEVARADVAVTMLGGFQDIFLPWQLADHAALRAAGGRPRLVLGPWVHTSGPGLAAGLREALAAFERAFDGTHGSGGVAAATTEEAPVAVTLSGDGGTRHLTDWPPPHAVQRTWFLRADHSLSVQPPPDRTDGAVRWPGTLVDYDPADPTPAVGGPILTGKSGPRDQTPLESRADVAVFTSDVLAEDLVALGPVSATVHLRAEVEHLDVFVRVCDVDPRGRSINVTDGLVRLAPGAPATAADGTRAVTVDLWPTGHRFAAGHRLRLQLSGGAHPRFARHPGTGDPLGEATTLVRQPREVLHDAGHPTAVTLAVEPRR
ncbi:CocE/NonD family hydrolase [Actinomycetospora lemnae]|uniref:CocE/NonD family hydrolase n=1 Tax=Actinomycetospora lemnae TaxID=3019891 RepID=A0ABT5SXD5_9PSEU|nr:CocE/NonD family hydrolase [Actinomycetospora sp. DW7H6]MDD7967515.1 CocE/NonD family hydrolase [Actinomycetospora sp. DW7H6]